VTSAYKDWSHVVLPV